MEAITYTAARQNLAKTMEKVWPGLWDALNYLTC
jgi:hypothetical protein